MEPTWPTTETTPAVPLPIQNILNEHTVIEPGDDAPFCNHDQLLEHVSRHVIHNRTEKWHQLLDSQVLSDARDEFSTGITSGINFKTLTKAYRQYISMQLANVCKRVSEHAHVIGVTYNDLGDPVANYQKITAWISKHRLVIGASSYVRGPRKDMYVLLTGYRCCLKQSRASFVRREWERLIDRQRSRNEYIFAIHDDGECQ